MKLKLIAILFILSLPFKPTARAQQLELPGSSLPAEFLNWFPELENQPLSLVPEAALPKAGTFWHLPAPGEKQQPPYPCPPQEMDHPIYAGPGNLFFVDENVTLKTTRTKLVQQPPPPGGGGNGTNIPPRPNIVNPAKYGAQFFSKLDTNIVAASNPTLYGCLTNFPPASAGPQLQIKLFGTNCVVVKASHFDYSAETRDFALLICDNPARAVWKNLSLTSQDTNDGWLVEGIVSSFNVSDPMWMMISNISSWPAVLRAIPYAGAVVQLTGPQPNAVVSNTISLYATVSDLSGVTNEQYQLTVNGVPARTSFAAGNTINFDSRYNVNGPQTVYLNAFNYGAQIYDPANPPLTQPLAFSSSGNLPLDLENAVYVAFGSDMCSPAVGTNNMLFYVNKPQQVACTISNPTNGQVMASYGGYVPQAGYVDIAWNFTLANGVTPYGGDLYTVTFTAYDPATLTFTNTVDRVGVRIGAGTMSTYEEENPGNPTGSWLNGQATTYIKNTLTSFYNNIYNPLSITQYQPWMVGSNRNYSFCYPRDIFSSGWPGILINLTNILFSDFTLAQVHGSGSAIGGDPSNYLPGSFTPAQLKYNVIVLNNGKNWRLRKACLWSCYSGAAKLATVAGWYNNTWPDACGIRPTPQQQTTYMRKNCGFFIQGEIAQAGFGGNPSVSVAQVAVTLDEMWVCGPNPAPGSCDPTYSWNFCTTAVRGQFAPELDKSKPVAVGYPSMIYSSVYDDLLMVNNTSFVHP